MVGTDRWAAVIVVIAVLLLMALGRWKRASIRAWIVGNGEAPARWRISPAPMPTDGPDLELGAAWLPLVIDPQSGHRRIEKIRFDGLEQVRRYVSVDTVVPKNCKSVPLGLINKREHETWQRPLRHFDLRTSSGESLARLGHDDHARGAWAVLAVATLRVATSQNLGGITFTEPDNEPVCWRKLVGEYPELAHVLWKLVVDPADDSERLLSQVLSAQVGGDPLLTPGQGRNTLALLGECVTNSDIYQTLIRRLAKSYFMAAEVNDGTSNRAVFKYALADPMPFPAHIRTLRKYNPRTTYEQRYLDDWDQLSISRKVRHFIHRILSWLGWMADSVVPTPLTLLPARTVHLEIEAPEGLRIGYADLERSSSYSEGTDTVRVIDNELSRHPTLAHLFIDGVRLDDQLNARLSVLPRCVELCFAGVAAGLLAIYLWLARPEWGSSRSGEEALLLLIPAAVGGYLLIKQHGFVRRVTRGVRVLVGAVGACALATVALVVASNSASPSEATAQLPEAPALFGQLWTLTAVVGTIASVSLLPVTLRAWPYIRIADGWRKQT